ncbi:hypothetical protein OE88DRAFT_1651440 [Heliocybe sulcata]|uniref:Uncharacterized protein n=1 Tax=Heliocybe sulcata TaxID=5364 RepID=A0A5C3NMC1_9AGAM|nr:hypothetical protein OE88DRAFT_1651440 [Heliocybe sulcata]
MFPIYELTTEIRFPLSPPSCQFVTPTYHSRISPCFSHDDILMSFSRITPDPRMPIGNK